MLRLLREKGLQTPFSGDTLNQKSGDGRALLRPRHAAIGLRQGHAALELRLAPAAIGLRPGCEPGKPAGCGGPAKNRGPAAAGRRKAGAAALDGLQPQAVSTGRLQRQRGESGPTADPLCKTAAGGSGERTASGPNKMKSRRTSLSIREKLLKRQRKSLGTLGESTKNLCRTDRKMQSQQDGPLLILLSIGCSRVENGMRLRVPFFRREEQKAEV